MEKVCFHCNGHGVICNDNYKTNDCQLPSGYFKCPCCNGRGVILRDQYKKDFSRKCKN